MGAWCEAARAARVFGLRLQSSTLVDCFDVGGAAAPRALPGAAHSL